MARKRYKTKSEIALTKMKECGLELDYMKDKYRVEICPKSILNLAYWGFVRFKIWEKNDFGRFIYRGTIMQNKHDLSFNMPLYYGADVRTSLFVTYVYCKYLEGNDKRIRETRNRLSQLKKKDILTMDEENEKRVLIGYPHLLESVKEKCPKCNGKMVHDNFQKCWDYSKGFPNLKACYQCIECKYRILFSLIENKFDKKPFGVQE